MFLLIPYRVDINIRYTPIANIFLISVTIFLSLLAFLDSRLLFPFILLRDNMFWGLLGYMFFHADLIHLLGNILFLWVFGNAVNMILGNRNYILIYLFLGIMAGVFHLSFEVLPAIGASGAINGIVAMFLMFYPLNKIHCFYLVILLIGRVLIRSMFIISAFILFDIYGVLSGQGRVAYWAHIGGFITGIIVAIILLTQKRSKINYNQRSMLDLLFNR